MISQEKAFNTVYDHLEPSQSGCNFYGIITQWQYDAMQRPVQITFPNGSVQQMGYNKAGLPETVSLDQNDYITNIDYNEQGQRTNVYFGNGSKTRFDYDSKNFRLIRLLTTRNTGQDILQDLNYTYDAVGNIVEIVDNAQQNHYFSNAVIEPRGKYEYDALYRLTKATGRELNSLQMPGHDDFVNTIALPNTGSGAMQSYVQLFSYDKLGNLQFLTSSLTLLLQGEGNDEACIFGQ